MTDGQGAAAPSGAAIAVTGATGFVGRYVVRELLRRGFAVRALARSMEKAKETLPFGEGAGRIDLTVGDATDGAAVSRLCAGAWGVVHLVGIRREFRGGTTFRRAHVESTQRVIEAARGAGARRLVHMSALGVRPNAPTEYHRTKHEAEMLVRESGAAWTILRPSLIHGPDGEFVRMVKAWATRSAPPYLFLPYFLRLAPNHGNMLEPFQVETPRVQPVAVTDVATAFAECLMRPETIGEVIALGGPEAMEWPRALETIRDAIPGTNRAIGPMGLPGPAGLAMAKGAAAVGMADALPFGPSEPVMASEDNVCSTVKAREMLGIEPRSLASAAREYGVLV